MGDGNIGIDSYVKRYLELCPGKAITLEIIVTGARKFPYFDPKFWDGYRNVPASEFQPLCERSSTRETSRLQRRHLPRSNRRSANARISKRA